MEKIKSISPAGGALTDIWIEEATEISYADFKQLDKRLRGQSRHEKRLTLSFNPVYKTHWIYREFFGGWDEGGRAYQSDTVSILKTTYQDNAFLTADDRAALENERDPYYRQVVHPGRLGRAGGCDLPRLAAGGAARPRRRRGTRALRAGFRLCRRSLRLRALRL